MFMEKDKIQMYLRCNIYILQIKSLNNKKIKLMEDHKQGILFILMMLQN